VTYDALDVVVVPFPFTDKPGTKRRPALVLSSSDFNGHGHSILAMITTKHHAPWPGDCPIEDLQAAGLQAPCMVRLKLFTLDNRLLIRKVGKLGRTDAMSVSRAVGKILEHLRQVDESDRRPEE